jgi:hypothetical protein
MLASGSRRDDRLYAVQEVRGYVHLGRSQMFFDKRSVVAAGIRWPCVGVQVHIRWPCVRVHFSTGTLSSMITVIGKSCGERMEWSGAKCVRNWNWLGNIPSVPSILEEDNHSNMLAARLILWS